MYSTRMVKVLKIALISVLLTCFMLDVRSDIAGINVRQMFYYTTMDSEAVKAIAQRRACLISYCPMPFCSYDDGWDLRGSDWGCCGNYLGCCERASSVCFWHDMECTCCKHNIFCGPFCVKDAHCYYDPIPNREANGEKDGVQHDVTDIGNNVTLYTESGDEGNIDNVTATNYMEISNSNTIMSNKSGLSGVISTPNPPSSEESHTNMSGDNVTNLLSISKNSDYTSSVSTDTTPNLQLVDCATFENCRLTDDVENFTRNQDHTESYDITHNIYNVTSTGLDDNDVTSMPGTMFGNDRPINSNTITTSHINSTTGTLDPEIAALWHHITDFGNDDFDEEFNLTLSNETDSVKGIENDNDVNLEVDFLEYDLPTTAPFVPKQDVNYTDLIPQDGILDLNGSSISIGNQSNDSLSDLDRGDINEGVPTDVTTGDDNEFVSNTTSPMNTYSELKRKNASSITAQPRYKFGFFFDRRIRD